MCQILTNFIDFIFFLKELFLKENIKMIKNENTWALMTML